MTLDPAQNGLTATTRPLMTVDQAWSESARLAIEHNLLVHAYSGQMLIATAEEQDRLGIRQRVLDKHKTTEQKRREKEGQNETG